MAADFKTTRSNGATVITLSGDWSRPSRPSPGPAASRLADELNRLASDTRTGRISFSAGALGTWDSLLMSVLTEAARNAASSGVKLDASGLPSGMASLLDMALAVPPRVQRRTAKRESIFTTVGGKVLAAPGITLNVIAFIGEVAQSIARFLAGRASFSSRDVWAVFRECGIEALPIVTLTSLLLGLILAFVSAMQLKLFGAEVYVASLVGVSMVRVMGPVLTGIVLSGRTGASFAAVIGSMQVNEEIDALTGFGISPMDFLVLPRVLGLALMTPLLAVYADVAGIGGGFLVGVFMLGITPAAYMENTLQFLQLSQLWIGLLHAFVFGFIISLCGCYQGIRSGRNASAVGHATTAAVVNSIVGIIIATSVITIIFTVIDL